MIWTNRAPFSSNNALAKIILSTPTLRPKERTTEIPPNCHGSPHLPINLLTTHFPTPPKPSGTPGNYAMEVLNAAGLTPTSLHKTAALNSSDGRAEPRKLFSFRFSKNGSLAVLSAVLGSSGLAKALTFEEALNLSVRSFSSFGVSADFDVGTFFDGLVQFGTENPLVVGGGALVVAVPLILSQILKQPSKSGGVASAKSAYSKLAEDAAAQLLDIREGREFKTVGSPDVRSLKKKAVSITYRGKDKPGFLKKLALKFKDPENTTLFILDKFDGNSELVAELATANGFKAAYAIKDGAEGTRGWMNSGLPWTPPKKTLDVDFDDLTEAISGAFGGSSEGLPVTLGVAAATGLALFASTEIETALQLLGSAALVQLVTKKLLFAEDRKVTLQQVDDFLNTKVAPIELVDDLKVIGKALLPGSTSVKASLPAPAVATPETSTSATPVEKADAVNSVPKAEVNSVPQAEVSNDSLPRPSRPLSPYPYYPDYKPPSSPSPAKP